MLVRQVAVGLGPSDEREGFPRAPPLLFLLSFKLTVIRVGDFVGRWAGLGCEKPLRIALVLCTAPTQVHSCNHAVHRAGRASDAAGAFEHPCAHIHIIRVLRALAKHC